MVATVLVFALGALIASLILLLLVPLVWRRAQRLARREFEATIPTSVNEIRAEVDTVRARSAFDLRREAIRADEAVERAARERAEAGRVVLENGQLRNQATALEASVTERDTRIASLEETLRLLTGERDTLHTSRLELRDKLQRRSEELEALAQHHHALKDQTDVQRQRLAAAETRILQLTEAMRTTGRQPPPSSPVEEARPALPVSDENRPPDGPSGNDRLRAAIAGRREQGGETSLVGAENAEIRERISDIAARVIQKEVEAEGENSPLRALIERPEPARENGLPSLAERVRRLLAENAKRRESSSSSNEEAPITLPAGDEATAVASDDDPSVAAGPATPPVRAAKRNGGGRSRPKSRR